MTNLKTLNLIDSNADEYFKPALRLIKNDNLSLLVNLESLKIEEISSNNPFKSLTKLINLKNLDISALSFDSAHKIKQRLGANLEAIGQLKKLEFITLSGATDFPVNVNKLQKQYPHVRFRWFYENEDEDEPFYYEGSFDDNNLVSGKGMVVYLSNGGTYEGEFKDGVRNGKGVYNDPTYRYEGEFKDGDMNGKGISYWSSGNRYEGEYRKGVRHGSGVLFLANGDRFEGEFDNGVVKLGTKYYPNGNRFSGEFQKTCRKGTMLYSNGNRYEGVYTKNERVGNGVFYHSNGEKVEGDESVFYLNDEDGFIVML